MKMLHHLQARAALAAFALAALSACGNGTAQDHASERKTQAAHASQEQPPAAQPPSSQAADTNAPSSQASAGELRSGGSDDASASGSAQIPGVAESKTAPEAPREKAVPEAHVSRFPRPEDVKLAPMGQEITPSALTNAPGYTPPHDTEADAVRTGRRVVDTIDVPFTGGESTPERLAIRVLAALEANDMDALQALRVNASEFTTILWPEFPQSRPITNAKVGDVWFFLDRRCHGGISAGLTDWGGQKLELLGLTYEVGRAPYTNFTLYDGVRIHVRNASGEEYAIKFVGTLAERNGVWKVYAYTDRGN